MISPRTSRVFGLICCFAVASIVGLAREVRAACVYPTGIVSFSIPESGGAHPANGAFYLRTFPSPDLVEIDGVGALTPGEFHSQYMLSQPLAPNSAYTLRITMGETFAEVPFTTTDAAADLDTPVPVITGHTVDAPLDDEPARLCEQISLALDCYDSPHTLVTTAYETTSPYVVVTRAEGRGSFVWPTACGPVFEWVPGELFEGGPPIRACYTLEAMAHDGARGAPSTQSCAEAEIKATDDDAPTSCAALTSGGDLGVLLGVLFGVAWGRRRRVESRVGRSHTHGSHRLMGCTRRAGRVDERARSNML